jgi:glutathione peroxidase
MKLMFIAGLLGLLMVSAKFEAPSDKMENKSAPEHPTIYSFTMKSIDGKDVRLSRYKGDVLMIVNVASLCGNTPQYKNLEEIYKKYKSRGFKILAFPANNFAHQEPGTNKEIENFCDTKYHVTFDMFSKISVKGEDENPLYHYLTHDTDFKGDIGWNFAKFLVDRNGNVVARYDPKVFPDSKQVVEKIKELLAEK